MPTGFVDIGCTVLYGGPDKVEESLRSLAGGETARTKCQLTTHDCQPEAPPYYPRIPYRPGLREVIAREIEDICKYE